MIRKSGNRLSEKIMRVFTLPAALLSQGLALRPETEADTDFLMRLYASTREEELAQVPWNAEQKQEFVAGQFRAQRHHYRTFFGDAAFDVLEQHGEPAGRLYLQVRQTQLHIIDITLMPPRRGRGTGTAILQALQAAGRAHRKGVGIMVEKFNLAMRLYRRLGFVDLKDHGVYMEMEWLPEVRSEAEPSPAAAGSSGS
jgi:GNAT superfamily N-acetyltransferase